MTQTIDPVKSAVGSSPTRSRVADDVILSIKGLKTYFRSDKGVVRAVDNISFSVARCEILAVVGESGSGKSVTALSVMGLVPMPPGFNAGGEVLFNGENLVAKSPAEMRRIRGRDIAMIFQDPLNSLNPVYTIGSQISEALRVHSDLNRKEIHEKVVDILKLVRIPAPEQRVNDYPFQLSGGQRQRVMIAMALICRPQLLIADEPTTALDVTIQAQILDLIVQLREDVGTSVILITHDLGVVAETADRVVVMYAGREVEVALVADLFAHPGHPYTAALLKSIPSTESAGCRLPVIPGSVPDLIGLSTGCRFAPRCGLATERCTHEEPTLEQIGSGRWVSCWAPLIGG